MVEYLEANSLLNDKQHGFRANRSCLTQMHGHFDDIYEGFTRFFIFYLKIQLIIIYINQALHFSHAKLQ